MQLKLENLKYQDDAIQAIVKVFEGTEKNSFDNARFENIRQNKCLLSNQDILNNKKAVALANGIELQKIILTDDRDICIEMETGTGKTLVYIKTIYELYKHYGFTKFIILVPSVAIRQGVLSTFRIFYSQLENIYGFKPKAFEYESKKLHKVTNFIEENSPQVMIMTLASFNSEDKILNQAQREDLFSNMPFIEAIGKTNPIIIMDEPQEGMDTENSVRQIAKLNPLFKLRYSATHKVIKNLLYRLTPYDSYKQGLVKKIEVLSVIEKNDEATLKIELAETQNGTSLPKAKLKAWHQSTSTEKFDFKITSWLKVGDNLGEKTNNPSYLGYVVSRINKSIYTQQWSITFDNNVVIFEKQTAGNVQNVWALQLEWLIRRHFEKTEKLKSAGIKCLSLIFIDRVANYMSDSPIIKNLFIEKYKVIYPQYNNGKVPDAQYINDIQGYYFAKKSTGDEFVDNEGGVKEQNKIYDLILKEKEKLLNISNPVQFIFSHSALGVGWDNPNIFNIATLNQSFSEIKKRQEIGRGLRISVNQEGQRIYDAADANTATRINQLTVIPNESYETFVTQYQTEIKAVYGSTYDGADFTHSHKGEPVNAVVPKLNPSESIQKAVKLFWKRIAQKTEYESFFDEQSLITKAVKILNAIKMDYFVIEVSSHHIIDINETGSQQTFGGSDKTKQKPKFTPIDIIEELSENSGLSYNALFGIINKLTNLNEIVKNPPKFILEASIKLKQVANEEMLRCLTYKLVEQVPDEFNFDNYLDNIMGGNMYADTPKKGIFDKMRVDSLIEKNFSGFADNQHDVVCFLKLPSYYEIDTPVGKYHPDFGLVMKRKNMNGDENDFYFVIETKGTNDINDTKSITENEKNKILCALKHFKAIGLNVHYVAPINHYDYFKKEAEKIMS